MPSIIVSVGDVKAFDCHSGDNTCEAHEKRLFVHAGELTFSPSQIKYY